MRFLLIDRVTDLQPGESLRAVKAVSLAEEYLADHFPKFPVLPGVFMIEALVQAAAMLVHTTNHFCHSVVLLERARNVRYKSFVKPGNLLELEVTARNIEDHSSDFHGVGRVGHQEMVEARFGLKHYNLFDRRLGTKDMDDRIRAELRDRARLVGAINHP